MPEHLQASRKRRTKLWLALAAVFFLLALVFVPPYISLNNYKARVTQSVAAALGRPVRLSEVELRVLPRPAFLLTDLTVQEEPAYGVEPVLHANQVTAAIRLSSLWQGKLQISRISVDEASLNLVHMPDGAWNLDSLFRNAAAGSKKDQGRQQPPYLEATNSRINIKDGIEKLPFSLLSADASMWRESNGNWRVRLKAQPARTDVSLDLADTGIVRMDATLLPAPQLSQMPLRVDLDWREAQLGQLSRLVLASDQGWRGDLTGELHLDGTAGSAKVQSRLRASGVHRAEFAPETPMDFDATCGFTLHYNDRSVEKLLCNSPVGDGRARITGSLPGGGQQPKVTVELDRIPAQAALDLLRTMRSSIDPSLQAAGAVSGHMTFDPAAAAAENAAQLASQLKKTAGRSRAAQARAAVGYLTGTFTVAGLRISGEALSKPIQVASMTLEPAPEQPGQPAALETTVSIPAGGPAPLALTARIALSSFELGVHGTAAVPRLREFAHVAGSDAEPILAQLAGDPAALDFTAHGPWVPPPDTRLALSPENGPARPPRSVETNGTVSLKNANWKPAFLANPVMISAATLHLENGKMRWDPVEFSYGAVKGSATLALPLPENCADPDGCPPQFTVHFAQLDAAEAEAALLGVRQQGSVISTLINRITPNSATSVWPRLEGTATADSLVMGPFTLSNATAGLKVSATGLDARAFQANLLGGTLSGKVALTTGDKPEYESEVSFTNVNPAQLGQLAGLKLSGGTVSGSGKLELSGFTDTDLAKAAQGTMHFEWQHGTIIGPGVPPVFTRFDKWSGDAIVADGGMKLQKSEVQHGSRKTPADATVTFGTPAKVSFAATEQAAKEKPSRP
ncbi:AsmA family protein [Occallatibacter riparius]|uniref:AsmA family protein n=1 Tax=Occallatibacter riparius TaxID=1002689 RepID=A0A9J7BGS8_9BACT|nr:AsmA family protein [Occallatibacter riparius]UWZ82180.1 AsmA family protein [Occallatibacter riparius]